MSQHTEVRTKWLTRCRWYSQIHLLNDDLCILFKIHRSFFQTGPKNNKLSLVRVMTWHKTGDKPLPEVMTMQVSYINYHICVTRSQWINLQSWLFLWFRRMGRRNLVEVWPRVWEILRQLRWQVRWHPRTQPNSTPTRQKWYQLWWYFYAETFMIFPILKSVTHWPLQDVTAKPFHSNFPGANGLIPMQYENNVFSWHD